MKMPQILRALNVFVDGRSHAGVLEKAKLPVVELETEEHRAGGMDLSIDVETGMKPLRAELTFSEIDPVNYGLLNLSNNGQVNFTLRGSLDQDGRRVPVVLVMQGSWTKIDTGDWQVGKKIQKTAALSLRYYALTIDNAPVVLIDVLNMKRVIGGVDQLAEDRKNAGL